jgi:hypothetical protein
MNDGPIFGFRGGRRRGTLLAMAAMTAATLTLTACSLLPGGQPALTLDVDGVTVTCDMNTSSIEGANPYGPGPEAETQCRAVARTAIGTLLSNLPNAEVQSVAIAANGAATVCFTNAGSQSCQQVLPGSELPAAVS